MGVMIDRVISNEFDLSDEERARFHARLANVIQNAIEP
jgi:hypothetical protein